MQTISTTYRFIASLLCISVLLGVSVPAGLHAKSRDMDCETMQSMSHKMPAQTMDTNHDCCMKGLAMAPKTEADQVQSFSKSTHNFGFACACNIEEAPLKTQAPAIEKTPAPFIGIYEVLEEVHADATQLYFQPLSFFEAYSPSPLFLKNSSFLI